MRAAPDPLALATAAEQRGDPAAVEHCLRVWAVSRASGEPPPSLLSAAQEAQRWAQGQGEIRIFASRLPDRLRIGYEDPTGLVDAVTVYGEAPDGSRIGLTQLETGVADRLEYRNPKDQKVVIFALSQRCGGAALERAILAAGPALAPPSWTPPPPSQDKAEAPTAVDNQPSLAWWWIVGGVVAAGLVGFAAYDELKR